MRCLQCGTTRHPKNGFLPLNSVLGVWGLCVANIKMFLLVLIPCWGRCGLHTQHPGCLFIYFPNIWTAVLWLSWIKAGTDAFCQQSAQRSGCSSSLGNSGTRWSPRKCRMPLHTECWIQLFKTQIPFNKNSEHIVAFLCLLYYTPTCEKEVKLFSCCIFYGVKHLYRRCCDKVFS